MQILVIDNDLRTANWLSGLLNKAGHSVEMASTSAAALAACRARSFDLILLDPALPDMNGLGLCQELRAGREDGHPRITIFSTRTGHDDIVAGLRAGADDYVVKRKGAEAELLAKITILATQPRPAAAPAPKPPKRGRVISLYSAKGGSGTTTLAVNIAYALHLLRPQASVLAADMVFPLGSVARTIGVQTRGTVAKLSQDLSGEMDAKMIAGYIAPAASYGFSVLSSSNDLMEAQSVEVGTIMPLFSALREMFNYIVVDFGHALSRLTLPVLEASDLINVIVPPDVNAVALTHIALEHLRARHVPSERIEIIQNRTLPRVAMSKEEIEQALGFPVRFTIPYDGEQMPLATNSHKPYLAQFENTGVGVTIRSIGQRALERIGDA